MSADDRWTGRNPSGQVEDRFPGQPGVTFTPTESARSGFGAGSEGAGSEVWDREPASSGMPPGWSRPLGTRGGEREQARRRVEAHPEVLPPHPMPVDRHGFKPEAHAGASVAKRALPVVGLFLAGWALPRLFGARRSFSLRRTAPAPELRLVLRSSGRRNRRAAQQLAESLRGRGFRGVLAFE